MSTIDGRPSADPNSRNPVGDLLLISGWSAPLRAPPVGTSVAVPPAGGGAAGGQLAADWNALRIGMDPKSLAKFMQHDFEAKE